MAVISVAHAGFERAVAGTVPLLTVLSFFAGVGVCVPIFMAVFVSDSVAPAQKEAICCKARMMEKSCFYQRFCTITERGCVLQSNVDCKKQLRVSG